MKILVTGGLGFIGSHLIRRLLRHPDAEVHAVDNLSNTMLDIDEIEHAITHDRPGRLVSHVCRVDQWQPDRGDAFDAIFHLASVVGPAAVLKYTGRISQSIITDTFQMIDLAQRHDCRLVFVSTSEVYGGGQDGFCQEQTPRVFRGKASARQEYAAAKMSCELSIENLVAAGQLDAVTIRPFNVAGRRQQGLGGFVVPRFVGQAMLGEPLTIFGDGTQLRAFTDARDVATAIELVAHFGIAGEVYNVGNSNNRVSIETLADRVLEVTDSESQKEYLDPRQIYGPAYADAANKFPDAGKLQQLGWLPRHGVGDVITDVFQSFQDLSNDRIRELAGLIEAEPILVNR